MNNQCNAKTKSGGQCKNKPLKGELYCKMHLYQKYEKGPKRTLLRLRRFVTHPVSLVILTIIVAVLIAVWQNSRTPSKEEYHQLVKEAITQRDEQLGILPPKTFEEILGATGMSCDQIGQAVCDKLRAAGEALDEGRYADAERMYAALMEIFGDSDNQPLKYNLGVSYYYMGKYDSALSIFSGILEKTPDDPLLLNAVGLALQKKGIYGKAESYLKRAIEIDEKILGPDHPGLATDLNNLAGLYDAQGKYAEAEPLYKRAIEIVKNSLGEDHPYHASSLNNLAGLYDAQGKYAEAEPLYDRALEIREETLGPDHPDVAQSLNNLALLYNAQGKYAEAEPLYKRALEIFETALGVQHPSTLTVMKNILIFYHKWGKEDEARKYEKRLAEIQGEAEQSE